MGHINVDYQRGVDGDADTVLGLSGFWGDAPILNSLENRRIAYGHIEDGLGVPEIAADGDTAGYQVEFTATGTPSFGSDAAIGGGLIIKTGTADNDEIIAVHGGGKAAPFRISDASTEDKKLWFEIAVDPDLITATQHAFFFGICETFDVAAAGLIETTGLIDSARDLIGFFKPEGDAGTVDFIYQKGGETLVTVLNGYTTLSTTTPKKLGFVYDPKAPTAERVRVYTDGIPETSAFVTGADIASAGTNKFPDAVLMAPTFGVKNAVGAAQTIKIPFWGCFQLR